MTNEPLENNIPDQDPDQPLGSRNRVEQIASLFLNLFQNEQANARAVSDKMAALFTACTADELLELDEQVRWLYDWNVGEAWTKLRAQDVSKLPATERSRGLVLGLASFHGNGYVREAAVEALDNLHDGTELPFLLIRNNDWVAKVQLRAKAATEQRVREKRFGFSVLNLDLLFRLLNKRRAEHSALVTMVVAQLLQPEQRTTLLNLLTGSNRFVRRTLFRLGIEISGFDQELIQVGLKSTDPVVRLWSIRRVSVFQKQDLVELLKQVENDSFLPVRREVLQIQLAHFPERAEQYLHAALLDHRATIRELARFHFRKIGFINFSAIYRELLKEQAKVAIAGLGESGAEGDAELILPYVGSKRSSVRKAAVRAVGRLAASKYAELLTDCLSDDSPSVSREAARVLTEQVLQVGTHRLWSLFQQDQRQHVKLAVLSLVINFSIWIGLPLFIEAAANSDSRIAAFAKNYCERLYNRVFTRPSGEQQLLISQSLDKYHDSLDPIFRASVRNWLSLRGADHG